MVVTLIEWERRSNGKWKKKDILHGSHIAGGVHTKRKINPNSPDYAKKLQRTMEKIFVYCEECKTKYCLANPCIHHLPDSPEGKAKLEAYKKKQKAARSEDINNQTVLDNT